MLASFAPASYFETAAASAFGRNVPAKDTPCAAHKAGELALDLITARDGFAALESEWNALFDRAAASTHLFQSFNWLWHWSQHFLTGDSLAIVTGRRDGRLVIICPFVYSERRGLKRLSFMGDPVSQYGDVIVEPGSSAPADIRAAWHFAVKVTRVDMVRLRKVRADAAIAPLLNELRGVITETQSAPYLDFCGVKSFADWEQRYSASSRRNRRRQMRRLQERGPTQIERFEGGESARDAVSLAISLKRAWLKDRGLVSSALADPRTEAFFRDCAASSDRPGGIGVAMLRSNSEVAAIEITVGCKQRRAIHIIAYNLKFEKSGAGGLLMEDSIKTACDGGERAFDLLAPGDSYKMDWTGTSIPVHDWAVGQTVSGKIYATVGLKHGRPAAKRAVASLPAAVRKHLATVLSAFLVVGG